MHRLGLLICLSFFPFTAHAGELPKDWAYRSFTRPEIPQIEGNSHPIDAFIQARLNEKKLQRRPKLDKGLLLRRLSLDLTGLPPTPEQLKEFLNDPSPRAIEKQIDRMLASPHYGERLALMWLDAVRYAESDGFKADDYRPHAWRYRDYVIQSFNSDKPFNRFVQEQIAGDELFPNDNEALIATGFLRMYPDEYNAVNLEQRRQEILNDITDTTGQVFLGLTLGCAKCHDHKTDPIYQEDYYRLQAFFAGWKPSDEYLVNEKTAEQLKALQEWEAKTAEIRKELAELEKPYREKFTAKRRSRFPEEYAKLLDMPESEKTPLQKQICAMIEKQVYADDNGMFNGMKPEEKQKYEALKKRLAEFGPKPAEPPRVMAMRDIGPEAPPTFRLKRGNWRFPKEELQPAYLSIIDDKKVSITPSPHGLGRRAQLAQWLTQPHHPLTSRVAVNRLWQHFFGRGIVPTSDDFGTTGERPTHPELLNWLAAEFVKPSTDKQAPSWSFKHIVRLIVTSETYQQDSFSHPEGEKQDPDNLLFWRQNRKRMEGETLRDAILAVSGTLNLKAGGPSVYPELPPEMKGTKWPLSSEAERDRRSIYVAVRRNTRYPLFAAFDSPERTEACNRRYETTTAPQALMLLNDQMILQKASLLGERIRKQATNDSEIIEKLFVTTLSRLPTSREKQLILNFVNKDTRDSATVWREVSHALLNTNEFIFID